MNKETLEAGFYRYFFRFAAKNDYEVTVTPYQASKVFNKVWQALAKVVRWGRANLIDLLTMLPDLSPTVYQKCNKCVSFKGLHKIRPFLDKPVFVKMCVNVQKVIFQKLRQISTSFTQMWEPQWVSARELCNEPKDPLLYFLFLNNFLDFQLNLTDEEKDAKAAVIKMLADPIYEKFLNARSVVAPIVTMNKFTILAERLNQHI